MSNHDWINRLVECQLKELEGQELSPDDAAFMVRMKEIAAVLRGPVEESLLAQAFGVRDDLDEQDYLRAAAASGQSVIHLVKQAIESGDDTVGLLLGENWVEVLKIDAKREKVEPCHVQDWKFQVETTIGSGHTEVTPYGGVVISFETLEAMTLEVDDFNHMLRLRIA